MSLGTPSSRTLPLTTPTLKAFEAKTAKSDKSPPSDKVTDAAENVLKNQEGKRKASLSSRRINKKHRSEPPKPPVTSSVTFRSDLDRLYPANKENSDNEKKIISFLKKEVGEASLDPKINGIISFIANLLCHGDAPLFIPDILPHILGKFNLNREEGEKIERAVKKYIKEKAPPASAENNEAISKCESSRPSSEKGINKKEALKKHFVQAAEILARFERNSKVFWASQNK